MAAIFSALQYTCNNNKSKEDPLRGGNEITWATTKKPSLPLKIKAESKKEGRREKAIVEEWSSIVRSESKRNGHGNCISGPATAKEHG